MSTALNPVPESAGEESYDWRRLHPVTPALRGWKVLVAFVAVVGFQMSDTLRQVADALGPGRAWLLVLGAVVLVGVVGFVYSALAWRVMRYAVTDSAVHLRTGLVFRQQRQARLDRLQAVDVVQPLLARLLGLAQLNLEVAGGAGSAVQLAFLRESEATALRAQILALAAGVGPTSAGAVPAAAPGTGPAQYSPPAQDGVPAQEGAVVPVAAPVYAAAPERQVYELPMPRLIRSILWSVPPWFLVALFGALVVVSIVVGDVSGLFVMVPAALGAGGYVWNRINSGATFRAAASPDGIRLRHGLTETRTQTVPPGRVQAVRLTQGPLWRRHDWWQVEINVAGYGATTDAQKGSTLHPVATRAEAAVALWLVLPDLGVDDPVAALDAALAGRDDDGGFTPAPRSARWVDPFSRRRHGVLVTRTALVMRSGRLWRTVVVVPHERTQSLGLEQGPLQRRLGLATFVAHSTPGPVAPRVQHLEAHVAAALLEEQSERARQARAVAGPELWMRAATADLGTGVAGTHAAVDADAPQPVPPAPAPVQVPTHQPSAPAPGEPQA
ncbi:membrane-flanked domain protein [Cellulomonas flavigena DSM 20109]|uniref:Membrane-flanked domain protein n=1 Tax=Cellulomonas flavigena (strain ATCC 482 / DSM 20109 / BCRC 11376 / JCM 18109 / NBRC 3775 / NCIMB 8073 / NRS 134) TaxID=446466 RepID=D5UIP6_CELFN|nr:PH domain-containing protein [Cellulomonas flavigena]ADG73545.1 membrane-flanked domain protein [Cellulomonas flavigena DSM 20109]